MNEGMEVYLVVGDAVLGDAPLGKPLPDWWTPGEYSVQAVRFDPHLPGGEA